MVKNYRKATLQALHTAAVVKAVQYACSNDSRSTLHVVEPPEEDNSSGKLESTHPSRDQRQWSDQGFFGVESVMRVNADSLLIRAAATSTSGTLNDLTTDLIMANNNNNNSVTRGMWC